MVAMFAVRDLEGSHENSVTVGTDCSYLLAVILNGYGAIRLKSSATDDNLRADTSAGRGDADAGGGRGGRRRG